MWSFENGFECGVFEKGIYLQNLKGLDFGVFLKGIYPWSFKGVRFWNF
jgi:hypothetical protein